MNKQLYKVQTGENNSNCYNIHFGNNDNCPLCQAIEQNNEENIKKKGIFPMIPNLVYNENSRNSWHSRRVYSSLSKILRKNNNMKINKYEGIDDNNNSKNKSKNRSISKDEKSKVSSLNKNIFNDKWNANELKRGSKDSLRKLNINRSNYLQNTFSTSNKFLSTKNQSIKYN